MKHQKLLIALVFMSLMTSLTGWAYAVKLEGVPFVEKQSWSIGIYTGESPFELAPAEHIASNPVLSARDVTDVPAGFVADPFMVRENSGWYMFFEVMNTQTRQGDIGLATSDDGLNWEYEQIVLDEPFHLSYPYVFKWQNEYYMIPESDAVHSVQLYKAVDFPTQWSFVKNILEGDHYTDASVFYYDDMWWMFVYRHSYAENEDALRLYYAEDLLRSWIEHPESPLIEGDPNITRPGGRVLVIDDRVVRFAQDDYPTYGHQVRAFETTELTTTSYEEREADANPVLEKSGSGWNGTEMHHLDAHQIGEKKWIACVDGSGKVTVLGIELISPNHKEE